MSVQLVTFVPSRLTFAGCLICRHTSWWDRSRHTALVSLLLLRQINQSCRTRDKIKQDNEVNPRCWHLKHWDDRRQRETQVPSKTPSSFSSSPVYVGRSFSGHSWVYSLVTQTSIQWLDFRNKTSIMSGALNDLESQLEQLIENTRQLGIIVSDFQPQGQTVLNQKM